MFRTVFYFLFFIFTFNIYAQDLNNIDPESIKNLSPDEIERLFSENFSSDTSDILNQPIVREPTLELQENIEPARSEKFGYDFINTSPTSISATTDLPVPNDYKISLNDELRVILTGSKKNIFSLVVQLDGTIFFPELGSISVAGETFSEVKRKLRNLVKSSYVGVDLDLSFGNLSAKKINIIGAVINPGTYLVNPFTTISNSLSYSGGISEFGSLRNIKLVKANGDMQIFDLYDLLVYGDRSFDSAIQSGDTIVVSGTDNFVAIDGAVIRPMIYEYREDDTYEDLINFSLGLNSQAEINNIRANINENSLDYTLKVILSQEIGNKILSELFIGSRISTRDKDIFVKGRSVTSGYFSIVDGDFSKLINQLKFSSDIYPFYAIYEQETNLGLSRQITSFSLADPNSYKNLKTTNNSIVTFFDRDYILESLNNNDGNEDDYYEDDKILISDYVQVSLPSNRFLLPLSGDIIPRQIHSFLGISLAIDSNKVSVITEKSSYSASYDRTVNSNELVAISFPSVKENLIDVEIRGEISNPGSYTISSSTTLKELYLLAGGLRDTAFEKGIGIYREEIKEKQIRAIKEAKAILTDSIIQKSASISDQGMVDIKSIIELADLIEPTGRIAGSFGAESDITRDFLLRQGDLIIVPQQSSEIVVQGEVLNSSSFVFEDKMSYQDYIDAAGGFTNYADKRSVFVIRANGQSEPAGTSIFSGQTNILPGDTIVVPRDLNQLEVLPLISMATNIISDVAFSAASLNAIQD
tara:strand:- start:2029 stop:4299 length:2271 start_codon:yes stop_codon:yes gene_type:complete